MAIIFKSPDDLSEAITGEWQNAGLINTDDASVLSLLLYPFQTRLGDLYSTLFDIHQAHRPSSAFGADLDEIVRGYGVIRKSSEPASDYTFENFRFYLPNGTTAKDYTVNRTGFTILAGQYVSDGTTSFITLDDAVFDADSHSAFVRTQGLDAAATYIPEGTVTSQSVILSSIAELDLGTDPEILCRNDKPLELESFLEDDNSLRDRYFDRVNSNGSNDRAILFALKTLGILDAEFLQDALGVGTLGVRLITGEPIISETTLSSANVVVRAITPYARVIIPEYIAVKLQLYLEAEDESLLESTKSDIIIACREYIDAIPIGGELNMTQLQDVINNVANVTGHTIRCMFLNERRGVLASQRAASDQKFILSREPDSVTFVS